MPQPMTLTQQLGTIGEQYFQALFDDHPYWAASLGFHEYDGRVPDRSAAARERRLQRLLELRSQLRALDAGQLSRLDRFDYALLESSIGQELFQLQSLRAFARDPLSYLWPISLDGYIKRSYAPLPDRVAALIEHTRQIPAFLDQARENLTEAPGCVLEVALDMFDGTIDFLRTDLTAAVNQVESQQLQYDFATARDAAIMATEQFLHALREDLLPQAPAAFAVGAGNFAEMLRVGELVDLPLAQLIAVGEADLQRNKQAALESARLLDPGRSPGELVRSLGRQHPGPDRLIAETSAILEEQRQFLIDYGVVSVPDEARCSVQPTPPFLRWAFAMMDTPGPFETVASESYYYVTLPPKEWPPEKQAEWLTKFDYWTLKTISVHEGYPGHYLHSLHTRRAPTRTSKILGAYSFWEGWAHYCEHMMLELGYGDNDPRLRLAQVTEALLRDCRFLCAIKMHTQGMTIEEARQFFMEHAFMERTTAEAEARRGAFDPGYLNYTLGKLLLLKLREDYRAEQGPHFSLRRFHDEVLSYGAPPIPYLRKLILKADSGQVL